MTKVSTTEERWHTVELQAAKLLRGSDVDGSVLLVNQFLAGRISRKTKTAALAFRADLEEHAGKRKEALRDYLRAHALSGGADYARYSVEISIAALYGRERRRDRMIVWYERALKTSLRDDPRVGARTISTLAQRRVLGRCNRELCKRVVAKAWQMAGFHEGPRLETLKSLSESAQMIARRKS